MMQDIPVVVALVAGILSFLSPCVFPLVPVYLASLCGPGIFDPGYKVQHFSIFLHALSFVVGLAIVFTMLGAGVGLIGFSFKSHPDLIRNVSGGLLIFFGLFLLAGSEIPWFSYERRLALSQSANVGYGRSLLTGSVFALAWTPCVGPVLASILALAWSSETASYGAYLLGFYSLGIGIPFLAIGAAFSLTSYFLKRINRYSNIIYRVSAVFLIGVGILVLLNKLTLIS